MNNAHSKGFFISAPKVEELFIAKTTIFATLKIIIYYL